MFQGQYNPRKSLKIETTYFLLLEFLKSQQHVLKTLISFGIRGLTIRCIKGYCNYKASEQKTLPGQYLTLLSVIFYERDPNFRASQCFVLFYFIF